MGAVGNMVTSLRGATARARGDHEGGEWSPAPTYTPLQRVIKKIKRNSANGNVHCSLAPDTGGGVWVWRLVVVGVGPSGVNTAKVQMCRGTKTTVQGQVRVCSQGFSVSVLPVPQCQALCSFGAPDYRDPGPHIGSQGSRDGGSREGELGPKSFRGCKSRRGMCAACQPGVAGHCES